MKLLRLLQEHTFERVGGNKTLRVDVRILSAIHRDLRAAVSLGIGLRTLYRKIEKWGL